MLWKRLSPSSSVEPWNVLTVAPSKSRYEFVSSPLHDGSRCPHPEEFNIHAEEVVTELEAAAWYDGVPFLGRFIDLPIEESFGRGCPCEIDGLLSVRVGPASNRQVGSLSYKDEFLLVFVANDCLTA